MKLLWRLLKREHTLLREDFEGRALPEGWRREVAAYTGQGPEALIEPRDGALRVQVRPEDQVFPALVRELTLEGEAWVKVSARMKTRAVDPERAVFDNCDVYVRFDQGPIQPLALLVGTRDWTPLERIFAVPPGARTLQIGLVLTMPGEAWFDDVQVRAVHPSWTVDEEPPFRFHQLGRDRVGPRSRQQMHAAFAEFSAFFGQAPPSVAYWKYPDNATKALYTGVAGNGHVVGAALHTVWTVDRHELVHIFAGALGDPGPLPGEGLAVWLAGDWDHKPVREAARACLDRWIPLPTLASAQHFRAAPDALTYPIAGALIGYLLETRGREALLRCYAAGMAGLNLEDLDRELRAWLS